MNAEQYLNEALGGNMNIGTLKPLAWHEIMEGYARHKLAEALKTSAQQMQGGKPEEMKTDTILLHHLYKVASIIMRTDLMSPLQKHQAANDLERIASTFLQQPQGAIPPEQTAPSAAPVVGNK